MGGEDIYLENAKTAEADVAGQYKITGCEETQFIQT